MTFFSILYLSVLFLRPPQILAYKLVELLVVLAEEPAQLGDDCRVHPGVSPPLALPQAFVRRLVAQTEEALRVVKVEVVPGDTRLQVQELLYPLQL